MSEYDIGEIIEGHFCWGCLPQVDHNIRSTENLEKKAICLYCKWEADGIDSTALVGNWHKLQPSR